MVLSAGAFVGCKSVTVGNKEDVDCSAVGAISGVSLAGSVVLLVSRPSAGLTAMARQSAVWAVLAVPSAG